MSDQRPSSGRATWREIVLYAPIGLVMVLADDLPKLADDVFARVSSEVGTARIVGKYAVRKAATRLARNLQWTATHPVPNGPPAAPQAVSPASSTPDDETRPVAVTAAAMDDLGTGELASSAVVTEDELPFAHYDSIAASHIVDRLEALSADELELLRVYEEAHRHRRTVLGRIQQLQSVDR
jgi:hypothetical protein